MRRLLIILILCIGTVTGAGAQNFTQKLQQNKTATEGDVTLHQSAEIDKLVNGNTAKSTDVRRNTTPVKNIAPPEKSKPVKEQPKHNTGNVKQEQVAITPSHTEQEHQRTETHVQRTDPQDDDSMEQPIIDTRKKVMRQSYKVTGFRVQAYAGGNTRAARQQAETIGNNIKMKYPDQPIYVHFYSPRWICRVGNFRSYEEAHAMLNNIKRMGYRQATIVKGKISVQY
jgi:hypothetical protein